jgi:hypothetical protein
MPTHVSPAHADFTEVFPGCSVRACVLFRDAAQTFAAAIRAAIWPEQVVVELVAAVLAWGSHEMALKKIAASSGSIALP